MANELKALLTRRAELNDEARVEDGRHEDTMQIIKAELHSVLDNIADCVEADTPKPAPKRRGKPNVKRAPDHDKAAKKYADFEPAATGCICGCGEHVDDGVNFVKGHQNQLRSIAGAVQAGRLSEDHLNDAGKAYAIAQEWMVP